jgi:porphobilinogen synthase
MSELNLNHVLQGGYFNKTLREWQSTNTNITSTNLMLPIFIHEDDDCLQDIPSLPEVKRFGINKLEEFLRPLVQNNLKSILLFGVIESDKYKDASGSFADDPKNPVTRAIPLLKNLFPDLTIACDVCLCAYTNHGHCGVFNEKSSAVDSCSFDISQVLDRETSVKRIASMALAFAKAGADIVAPSDMMDGRVHEIKKVLNENKLLNRVCVMSYSTKFSSSFYGPFRDAAKSAPSFGNRKCYQLPCGSTGLAIRASERDVEEGADILMVKPCLTYLDIVKEIKQRFPHHPLAVYQVSGEYAMIYHGAKANAFSLRDILIEIMTSTRRAGADIIISYYTPMILQWLKEDNFNIS